MSRLSLALAATVTALLPAVALAVDSFGTPGYIRELDVVHITSDTYLQFHGRIVLEGGARPETFLWGGTACSNMSLSDAKVAQLQSAMVEGLLVTPRYEAGQGLHRCLVGFTLRVP